MQILSFHKISKPYIDGGVNIDLRPKGKLIPRILQKDGRYRYPFGEKGIENAILNGYINGFLSDAVVSSPNTGVPVKGTFFLFVNAGTGLLERLNAAGQEVRPIHLFSPMAVSSADTANRWGVDISLGESDAPISFSDTSLTNQINATTRLPFNAVEVSESTGNITFTIVRRYEIPAPPGGKTYREAGLFRIGTQTSASAQSYRGLLGGTSLNLSGNVKNVDTLISRLLFPTPLSVNEGEILDLVYQVRLPSLIGNGTRVDLAASNGMDISGLMKLVGITSRILGGTIDQWGNYASSGNFLPSLIISPTKAYCNLSTNTTHAAFNTASNIHNNSARVLCSLLGYTNNSRFRDYTFNFPVGYPATDTAFRSISFTPDALNADGQGQGYQLLLDNEMTKAANASLHLTLRLSM